jgi:glycosyltransferase involved in cell wall biosynthesis
VLRVAINAQLLSDEAGYRGAGVSNYARQLLMALGELAQDPAAGVALTAFVHARHFSAPGVELRRSSPRLAHPLARIAWEQTALPGLLGGADIHHGLMNVLPLLGRTPAVVTVHDLAFVRTPEMLPPAKRWYLTRLCAASVRKAAAVIAVSQQTADDLMRFFATPAAKITVIHNGVGAEYRPAGAAASPWLAGTLSALFGHAGATQEPGVAGARLCSLAGAGGGGRAHGEAGAGRRQRLVLCRNLPTG